MALIFHRRAAPSPRRVALFPGAYNPPTVAHLAIAEAAFQWANEVVWVLPRAFPHKPFEYTTFEERIEMLGKIVERRPGFSVASAEGGLYAEIADEAREFFGENTEIALACGRDAAHRIATWDYGDPDFFASMLRRYPLLVASRNGEYQAELPHRDRIVLLSMDRGYDDISSTEVRNRIGRGQDWRILVPDAIADHVATLYSSNSGVDTTANLHPKPDTS